MTFSKNLEVIVLFVTILACSGAASPAPLKNNTADGKGTLGVIIPTAIPCWFDNETAVLVQMEVTDCAIQPCYMDAGSTYELAPTFIPAHTTSSLTYRLDYYYQGTYVNFGVTNHSDTFVAGTAYKIVREVVIPQRIRNHIGHFHVLLEDETSAKVLSRCVSGLIRY
ncbi:uncharacterized protein LOC110859071 [Folsomia candida]|uniref:uncharacterized protein LOC110859071 n=1 Tax=Folsomia candida TaxID=158441 RepID=UPI000B8F9D4D|nr:uncharacterized protein LOC110859071 [Folsomia candida]